MAMEDSDVKQLSSHDHEVLGVDFCSGYTDIFGKWNTGFDCPRIGNGETVYCCGTGTYKYCCTRRDQHTGSGISQSIVLGSALGSVMVIILVSLVSCLICRRCVPYRRQHPSLNGGPLYALHCSSTASEMANVYSFPGQPSIVTTPMDNTRVLVDLDAPEHTYTVPMNPQRGLARHLVAGGVSVRCQTPTDPPPSYTEANALSSDISAIEGSSIANNSFDLRTSRVGSASQNRSAINQRPTSGCGASGMQNALYWSTKF